MRSLTTVIGIAALSGILTLTACVEREPSRVDSTGESGDVSAAPVESPTPTSDPTATPTQEPIPSRDPDDPEATSLEIPRYELSSGNREIYVMDADGSNHQRITEDQAQYHYPVWSPSGSRIAAVVFDWNRPGESIVVMNADGSERREIADEAGNGPISWSPDGEMIVFGTAGFAGGSQDQLYLVDADGSNERQLTNSDNIDPEERYAGPRSPAFSPDGESVVFTAMRLEEEKPPEAIIEMYVVDVSGDGTPRLLTDAPDIEKGDPTWSPDGQTIVFTGYAGEGTQQAIYAVDASGDSLRVLTDDVNQPEGLTWSPDGERIAFSQELFANRDIYVMNAEGSNIERLTDDESTNESPAWSPDGARIAYIADGDARLAVPCTYAEEAALGPPEPFEVLAWTSYQVVVGTITEKKAPAWAEPGVAGRSGGAGPCLQIVTDYIVEVETRYRGEPLDTLRVRARGGRIGEYEQHISPAPSFEKGDRVLFFLPELSQSELLPSAHFAWGQHSWDVSRDGQVHANSHLDSFDVLELDEVAERIQRSLASEPPDDLGSRIVPLDEAPVPSGGGEHD